MRVISQNKDKDIPYELSAFLITESEEDNEFDIEAYVNGDPDAFFLASYSDEALAKRQLVAMRTSYLAGEACFEFGQTRSF